MHKSISKCEYINEDDFCSCKIEEFLYVNGILENNQILKLINE